VQLSRLRYHWVYTCGCVFAELGIIRNHAQSSAWRVEVEVLRAQLQEAQNSFSAERKKLTDECNSITFQCEEFAAERDQLAKERDDATELARVCTRENEYLAVQRDEIATERDHASLLATLRAAENKELATERDEFAALAVLNAAQRDDAAELAMLRTTERDDASKLALLHAAERDDAAKLANLHALERDELESRLERLLARLDASGNEFPGALVGTKVQRKMEALVRRHHRPDDGSTCRLLSLVVRGCKIECCAVRGHWHDDA